MGRASPSKDNLDCKRVVCAHAGSQVAGEIPRSTGAPPFEETASAAVASLLKGLVTAALAVPPIAACVNPRSARAWLEQASFAADHQVMAFAGPFRFYSWGSGFDRGLRHLATYLHSR